MASKLKKNDKVKVICGKDKGKVSEILKLFPKSNKALISGVNIVKKHVKPSKSNPEGGIVKKEMPIHISNIMYMNVETGSTSKVGFKFLKDGTKVRFFKKLSNVIESKKV